jgi:hypothetical protein
MEVPCCTGLVRLAAQACELAALDLAVKTVVVSTCGVMQNGARRPASTG